MSRRCNPKTTVSPDYLCNRMFLPEDLMLKIFRYLDSKQDREASSLVCKRWLNLVRLSRETICIGLSHDTDTFVNLLTRRFPNVKHVYIDESRPMCDAPVYGRPSLINTSLITFLDERDYEYSEITMLGLSNFGLATIEAGFTRLVSLNLIYCRHVTDEGLISIAEKCKLLKFLDLQDCCVGDKGLAAIAKYCTHLEGLNLEYCNRLTDTGFLQLASGRGRSLKSLGLCALEGLSDVSFEAIGFHLTCLETLWIGSDIISEKCFLSIVKGCSSLKSMKLSCRNITDDALQGVGNFCSLLETLSICYSKGLTDKSLLAIGKGCGKLKNLSLSHCEFVSDLGLASIAAGCPELVCFTANYCGKIGIDGLNSIAKACIHLSELALLPSGCQKLNFKAQWENGIGSKYLQTLYLIRCSDLGDEALHDITRECRNLKMLNIQGCHKVGNEGLISVGRNCNSLTNLILSSCSRVGDAGIIAIARNCSQLSLLDVQGVQNLGDTSMEAIGEGCPLLKNLNIGGCHQISDAGLMYIANNSKLLESCYMLRCQRISRQAVATLIASCPLLNKVSVEDYKYCPRIEIVGDCHGKVKFSGQMWSTVFLSDLRRKACAPFPLSNQWDAKYKELL